MPPKDITEQDREFLSQVSQEMQDREKQERQTQILSVSDNTAGEVDGNANSLIRREEQLGVLQKSIDTSNYSKVSEKLTPKESKLEESELQYTRLD